MKDRSKRPQAEAGWPNHMQCPLTPNGEDHDDEVKHIPAVGEVVMSQGKHLHDTLSREDSHKELVDFVQDFCLFFTLLISLHHHGDHVAQSEKWEVFSKELENVENHQKELQIQ